MAEIGESAEVSGRAGWRDHADNIVVFWLLMVLAVTVGQNLGRYAARRAGSAGALSFFGG